MRPRPRRGGTLPSDAALLLVALLALLVMCCGCASPGRVSVLEWDSRDDAQIRAQAADTAAFYGSSVPAATEKAEKSATAWAAFLEIVSRLRVRVRVLSVEWAGGGGGGRHVFD